MVMMMMVRMGMMAAGRGFGDLVMAVLEVVLVAVVVMMVLVVIAGMGCDGRDVGYGIGEGHRNDGDDNRDKIRNIKNELFSFCSLYYTKFYYMINRDTQRLGNDLSSR